MTVNAHKWYFNAIRRMSFPGARKCNAFLKLLSLPDGMDNGPAYRLSIARSFANYVSRRVTIRWVKDKKCMGINFLRSLFYYNACLYRLYTILPSA